MYRIFLSSFFLLLLLLARPPYGAAEEQKVPAADGKSTVKVAEQENAAAETGQAVPEGVQKP